MHLDGSFGRNPIDKRHSTGPHVLANHPDSAFTGILNENGTSMERGMY